MKLRSMLGYGKSAITIVRWLQLALQSCGLLKCVGNCLLQSLTRKLKLNNTFYDKLVKDQEIKTESFKHLPNKSFSKPLLLRFDYFASELFFSIKCGKSVVDHLFY